MVNIDSQKSADGNRWAGHDTANTAIKVKVKVNVDLYSASS